MIKDLEGADKILNSIYDPVCGTGGMLTSCKDFINSINQSVDVLFITPIIKI